MSNAGKVIVSIIIGLIVLFAIPYVIGAFLTIMGVAIVGGFKILGYLIYIGLAYLVGKFVYNKMVN